MNDRSPVVEVLPTPEAVARKAAEVFCREAQKSLASHNRFTVSLSGGKTPRRLYSILAEESSYRDRVPWSACHFFFGDERHVPPEHSESNYRLAQRALFSRVPVPPAQCHRIRSELRDPHTAAKHYQETLREFFGDGEGPEGFLDLTLLGLGADGHTASLFPGSPALRDHQSWVEAVWVETLQRTRITLTPHALNRSALVMFLVTGAHKAGAVRKVLEGEWRPLQLPAQVIRPRTGRLIWLLDSDAGSRLGGGPPKWE